MELKKDGSLFPVEAGLNPFKKDGEEFVMSLIIDISVRMETERQIHDLNSHLEEKESLKLKKLRPILAQYWLELKRKYQSFSFLL